MVRRPCARPDHWCRLICCFRLFCFLKPYCLLLAGKNTLSALREKVRLAMPTVADTKIEYLNQVSEATFAKFFSETEFHSILLREDYSMLFVEAVRWATEEPQISDLRKYSRFEKSVEMAAMFFAT
jgi:hypothetical protein